MVDKSEKFSWLVRVGYAARGLTYFLLGYLALGARAPDEGNQAVFEMLQDVPGGTAILYVMAVGLLAYALFKFVPPSPTCRTTAATRKACSSASAMEPAALPTAF